MTMDFWDSLIRMVSALAVVLGLMLILAAAVRRWFGPGAGGMTLSLGKLGLALSPAKDEAPLVQILGTGYLGPKKSIALVAVAGDLLVVGSTADNLVPLGRISDAEQVRRILGAKGLGNGKGQLQAAVEGERAL
jgi:flagellar protein FliO/FliZ